MAVDVPRREPPPRPQELLDRLAPQIARYKLPRHLVFWDELPKSAYGKITRKMIREELAARGQLPAR